MQQIRSADVRAPINAGDPSYWQTIRENISRANRLIAEANSAHRWMKNAPMYRSFGYDEYGDPIFEENMGPFDDFAEAFDAVIADETAMRILSNAGITRFGDRLLRPVPFYASANLRPAA